MSGPTVYVAIDIIEDQVVRLTKGVFEERSVYGDDPVETAIEWQAMGARWLHVIDLDGASKGEAQNSTAITEIISKVSIPVQVGGGVRTMKDIEAWVVAGAARVAIGTRSLDADFMAEAVREFGDKIMPAIDTRHGRVQVGGWMQESNAAPIEAAKKMQDAGVARIMFTDIERDGTLTGPNIEAVEGMCEALSIPVIASGGVGAEHDVRRLAKLWEKGVEGIIIGKALYSGALTLEAALEAAEVA